jgi:hypothetical protein
MIDEVIIGKKAQIVTRGKLVIMLAAVPEKSKLN